MATLEWIEDWRSYPVGPLTGAPWQTPVQPSLANSGRDGKRAVNWSSDGILRPGSATLIAGCYRVDSGGNVITPLTTVQGFLPDILTCANWLMGGSWNGWPYCGIVATEDGALHVHRGGAFARGPGSQDTAIVASSAGGVVPIGRGWFFLETFFVWDEVSGRAIVRVNGETVINYLGPTTYPYPFCELILGVSSPCGAEWPTANAVVIGNAARGGFSLHGWTGAIDFLASFTPVDENDVIGTDLRVDDLIPVANGDTVQSDIAGTSPAPTHWQSVDDGESNDGAVTTVSMHRDDVPLLDEYEVGAFPFGSGTIYGVQAVADARTSVPGYADIQLGLKGPMGTNDSSVRTIRSNIFNRFAAASPEKPGGGAWDVAALADLQVRFQRKV